MMNQQDLLNNSLMNTNIFKMDILKQEGNGITSAASSRRMINLNFISKMPLDGLKYDEKEMMVKLYKTYSGEELFLQYPGKESVRKKNPKPRDFRPKLLIKNEIGPDLSFGDVWAAFFDMLKNYSVNDKDFLKAIDYLIILFYKSAYYIDFIKIDNPKFVVRMKENKKIFPAREIDFEGPVLLFDQDIHRIMFEFIQNKIGNICGMSVEAFVLYNDILAWNEDYKYYTKALSEGKKWSNNGVGKPNNPLTHISILGYIRGEFKMSEILNRFVRTRGVSVPTKDELQKFFDDYINEEIQFLNKNLS